jgi:short-subunit dehydrogenase
VGGVGRSDMPVERAVDGPSRSPLAEAAAADPARPVALVTGASSGIGSELARELARDGHDLVLVARRAEPMDRLADELKAFGASAIVIAADLAQPGAARSLAGEIDSLGLTVDVLINNAGVGGHGRFDRTDFNRLGEMLQLNIVALTELTRLLLPGMVARRRGRVMLVASTAAFQPGPQMAVYCATKAYVLSFGEAIAYELGGTGVTITTLCPGATATEFSRAAGVDAIPLFQSPFNPVMSAARVAKIGYRALKSGRRVVVSGFLNTLFAACGRFAPRILTLPIANSLMSTE